MDKASSILFLPKEWVAFRDGDREPGMEIKDRVYRTCVPPPVAQAAASASPCTAGAWDLAGIPSGPTPSTTCGHLLGCC